MYVIATAGHVDHGKSTLVRALTGMEPDRLDEEQQRGLTIDLGFAWTALPSGRELAFVDVPGHERFLANMLAGVGPAPAVLFVVAADKGWQAQSTDHRDAVIALGVTHGVIAITRVDRAPERVAEITAAIRIEFAGTALAQAPIIEVSVPGPGVASSGLDELVRALDTVLADAPTPSPETRVRLWVDRAFSIRGSGTVVTGTLTAGRLHRGAPLVLVGAADAQSTEVRGLHSQNLSTEAVSPYARVAVNLRDVPLDRVTRGDALITPDAWEVIDTIDVRRTVGVGFSEAPQHLIVHIGTVAINARLRPFDDAHARLMLQYPLPLQLGDRLVLRGPGSRSVLGGAVIIDVDPPPLTRRGDGARWAGALANRPIMGDPVAEVTRRGAMPVTQLRRLGVVVPVAVPAELAEVTLDGTWWVHVATLDRWAKSLRRAVADQLTHDPLTPGLPRGAAQEVLRRQDPALPDPALLPLVIHRAKLEPDQGALRPIGHRPSLGPAEASVAALEARLRAQPFAAPEADDLLVLSLGPKELATAARAGRLLRLIDGVVLLPDAPALAMRTLAALSQPFTLSEARKALDTTRRVAVPLLEHLDARGWTRRLDGTLREVSR